MRKSGPRGSRAKRRQLSRPAEPPDIPAGWPESEVLRDALDVNELAHRLLADMRPETVRTILKRMETPARKAVFEPHNIPVTKVGLRSAGQVLALLRADESPAESTMLGAMLNPAADLFHHATIGSSEVTGLRLKLADLALSLLEHNDSVVTGLRTWHRWAEDAYEDLTLAVVIGLKCSHATLAGAYLAASHADIAERYNELRNEYPRMPEIGAGRLTETNPVTRYLAARPDRKLPANPAELRAMLAEDSRVRRAELGQAQRERHRERHRKAETAPEAEAATEPRTIVPAVETRPADAESSPPRPEPDPEPGAPALPEVTDWAAAVTASRRITERLVAGEPPAPADLAPLRTIFDQLDQMSTLLSHVMGQPVEASRSGIDAGLTLILSDPALSRRLGAMPRTRAEVTDRLRRLRATSAATSAEPGAAGPSDPAANGSPTDEGDRTGEPDLSDLDTLLRGEVGAKLSSLAATETPDSDGGTDSETSGSAADSTASNLEPIAVPPSRTRPAKVTRSEKVTPPETAETPAIPAQAGPSEPTAITDAPQPKPDVPNRSVHELVAIALHVRVPQGALAQRFQELVSELDIDDSGPDGMAALCTAMPVSLIDPAAGGVPLLSRPMPELSSYPALLSFRESIAGLCRQGVRPRDPTLVRLAELAANLRQTAESAREILAAAETRTLKFDKATKVYRHWLSPGGRLRPLVDALLQAAPMATINRLAEECRKLGAARAIDDTAAELIDANRTKIVAGARKTLTDKFTEVLELADAAAAITDEIEDESRIDRAAAWRFDALTRFREQAASMAPKLEKELATIDDRYRPVAAVTLRALSLAISLDPLYGPEHSPEAAMSRLASLTGESA